MLKNVAARKRMRSISGAPTQVFKLIDRPTTHPAAMEPNPRIDGKARDLVESDETHRRVPPLKQMSDLVKSLDRFVWHDSRSFNSIPRIQEQLRFPGFASVADTILPLLINHRCDGWPIWFPQLIDGVIMIFETIAYTWGWGELLKPEHVRKVYLDQCNEKFRDKYLIQIQNAARLCRSNFSIIDRPHWLEEIIETIPSIEFDLNIIALTDYRFEPLWQPLHEKRNALMCGINYPTLHDYNDVDKSDIFKAEVELGLALGQATRKLANTVSSMQATRA